MSAWFNYIAALKILVFGLLVGAFGLAGFEDEVAAGPPRAFERADQELAEIGGAGV